MLKAIRHIQPEVTPIHIMGIDPLPQWLAHFGAHDYVDLREKLDLDIQRDAGRVLW